MINDSMQHVENKMPLVTIIIPVYRVERFLNRCLDSVINQTYKNIEILVVVDLECNVDRSAEICRHYEKAEQRLIIIDQKNRGLSGARNEALDKASGEYIMFIDGDDFIDEHMTENLLKTAQENHSDLVIGNFQSCNAADKINYIYHEPKYLSGHDAFNLLIDSKEGVVIRTAWGKLYSRELIGSFRYREHSYCEDMLMIHHILDRAKVIYFDPTIYYYYVMNENSLDRSSFKMGQTAFIDATREWMGYIADHYPDLMGKAVSFHIRSIANISFLVLTIKDQDIKYYLDNCGNEIRKYKSEWIKSEYLETREKIKACLVMKHLWGMCKLLNRVKGRT